MTTTTTETTEATASEVDEASDPQSTTTTIQAGDGVTVEVGGSMHEATAAHVPASDPEPVTIEVASTGPYVGDDEVIEYVQLGTAPLLDVERALITAVIDMQGLRQITWSFHIEPDGSEFSSHECRAVWRMMLGAGTRHLTRDDVRKAFPRFRFVRTRYPLRQLAARLFNDPRTMGPPQVARPPRPPAHLWPARVPVDVTGDRRGRR